MQAIAYRSRVCLPLGQDACSVRCPWTDEPAEHLFKVFQDWGGIQSGDEVAFSIGTHANQPVSRLGRWIVSRKIVSLELRGSIYLPLFQFDLSEGSIQPASASIIAELADAMNERELLTWFARPNGWLGGFPPVAVILSNGHAALDAARADRFAIKG